MVPNRPEQHGRVLEGLLCNMRRTVQVKDLTKVGLQRDRGRLHKHLLPDGIQLKTDLTQPRIKQTLAIRKESRRALQVIGQPVHVALNHAQQGWNCGRRLGGWQWPWFA